jgi:hypothetical protein
VTYFFKILKTTAQLHSIKNDTTIVQTVLKSTGNNARNMGVTTEARIMKL